jgi:hypothetical protein
VLGRHSAARRCAADQLLSMITIDDLDFALQLSREQSLDLQMRGVDLLAALPDDRSSQRLIELLSKDPALAGAACRGLVRMGAPAVPMLQRVCGEVPVDRGFAYSAFALAQIGEAQIASGQIASGQAGQAEGLLVPAAAAPGLVRSLRDADALTSELAAIALADMLFFSTSASGIVPDAEIVDVLLDVAEPLRFVPNLDMLRQPADERLLRLTGRVISSRSVVPWRTWWKDQRNDFLGLRARIEVSEADAAHAVVVWWHEQRQVRLIAEGLADTAPIAGATEVL